MSIEDTPPNNTSAEDMNDPPGPIVEPDPDPEPQPVPDPIPGPTEPIPYEPQTWYSITWTCRTAGCPNENQELSAPEMYSNDGKTLGVFCGRCNKKGTILTATKLDPQPEPE
ncbi:hypothetical protein ACFV4E_22455 [Streptomyces hygroscopicus]|uniref:Uncharacterized protein n=1 Tax=Streptomyces hygroscopicus TaxID=1912 RepID=A0ABQ3UFI5_STRHY|nr:hypothetical protein [Streptomyces hygroscopicus]GHJ34358.1 hypothetical protein TPA0910_87910 [Streptomyces hygroscopicus]GHJ34374.1 hypothetical protein TPA0910_88070 [Streptomyces hygroscopicus]